MQKNINANPPTTTQGVNSKLAFDQLWDALQSSVTLRSGSNPPEDAIAGEIWLKNNTDGSNTLMIRVSDGTDKSLAVSNYLSSSGGTVNGRTIIANSASNTVSDESALEIINNVGAFAGISFLGQGGVRGQIFLFNDGNFYFRSADSQTEYGIKAGNIASSNVLTTNIISTTSRNNLAFGQNNINFDGVYAGMTWHIPNVGYPSFSCSADGKFVLTEVTTNVKSALIMGGGSVVEGDMLVSENLTVNGTLSCGRLFVGGKEIIPA